MSEREGDIVKLIRLKRFERPQDGYFEDFVSEFQCRQRSELLRGSARGLFCERVATYFSSFGLGRQQPWWIGAGAAAVLVVSLVYIMDVADDGVVVSPSTSAEESVLWGADFELPEPSMDSVYPVFDESRSRSGFGELIPVSGGAPQDF